MIKIYIPYNHLPEREYIINQLFVDYLGLNIEILCHEMSDYKILLENNKKLIVRDHFFSDFNDSNYLNSENIPKEINYYQNPFIVEKDIPVIFGTDELIVDSEEIICGIDIFASSFFMLTRWEEFVKKERDLHNRFPAIFSVAYKNGFLERPIVNEYVEMLWNILLYLNIDQEKKKHTFEMVLTHDVDEIHYYSTFRRLIRSIGGDILKHNNVKSALSHVKKYYQVKNNTIIDPFDTFDWIMDISESINVKSRFYFMAGGTSKYDNSYKIYNNHTRKIINKIKERNHIIGFHPSYNAYNDEIQWAKEKNELEENVGLQVYEGRQHYLRFDNPITWSIWDKNKMKYDLTVGYPEIEGFRCGTCYDFLVFDIINRKALSLRELPLMVMDVSLNNYQKKSPYDMQNNILSIIKKVKLYNGRFVFLWHNSNFCTSNWIEYKNVYINTLHSI